MKKITSSLLLALALIMGIGTSAFAGDASTSTVYTDKYSYDNDGQVIMITGNAGEMSDVELYIQRYMSDGTWHTYKTLWADSSVYPYNYAVSTTLTNTYAPGTYRIKALFKGEPFDNVWNDYSNNFTIVE